VIPREDGNYHFAEAIVDELNKDRKYHDILVHFQKNDMNIGTRRSS
jgi:hypothetical protein